jgi:glycosyltransferase involved in cell wall biosynthesis
VGGPAVAIAELVRQLDHAFQFFLIVGQPLKDEQDAKFLFANIKHLKIINLPSMHRMPSLWNDYRSYKQLCAIVKEINPDVVHTHGTKPGLLGRLAANKWKVPIIIHTYHGHIFHSYFNKLISSGIVLIEKYLAKKSNYIIAISNFLYSEIIDKYKIATAEKVIMIPLGLDLSAFAKDAEQKRIQFRNQYHIAENEFAIGIVGRITAVKNMTMFIDVIERLKADKRIKFLIIGDGDEKQKLIEALDEYKIPYTTNENNSRTHVIFTSWLLEMDKVMLGLDILCLTSLNEGTPVSIIEAMAAQKPIVATNAGSVSEIVKHDENGLVAENNNVDTFVTAIERLIASPEMCKKMGINGQALVYSLFDPKMASQKIAQVYNGKK